MQKILFTGARSGIINRVVDKVIDKYYVYVTVHTSSELEVVKEKYKDYDNVECFKLDVTKDKEKLKDLDIDILVSNAAIGESGSVSEINMDKVRNNFEVNVFSNFEVVQVVLKNMIKKGKGRVIIMSSLAGVLPLPFLGSYCATKASISKLTETLNLEMKLLKAKIDVCLIEPGLYDTGFNRLMIDKKYDWMEIDSYFKSQIDLIRKSENIFLLLGEKKKLNSIVNSIYKAITAAKPKFIYSRPISQWLLSKIYSLLR